MPNSPRIAVIGSANTDLTTFTEAFPRPGETVFGRTFEMGFGGKGANQAVAARLCGAQVLMVAKVGDDVFGRATLANFASFGIDTTHVQVVPDVPTGVAPIFVEPSGQNRIIVVKGANDRLTPVDVDAAATELRNVDVIILQFEIPLQTIYHAIRFARAHNIRCLVNPAPAIPAELAQLTGADLFIPNESEAEQLTGCTVRSEAEAVACATTLLGRGFRRVVITLGERGSLVADVMGHTLVPAFPVTSIDTSGAGDAFIGSLAVFLAEGLNEHEALSRANLYAALSTTRVGTQKSFPPRADLEREWVRRQSALSGSGNQSYS
jgi:ribokinase